MIKKIGLAAVMLLLAQSSFAADGKPFSPATACGVLSSVPGFVSKGGYTPLSEPTFSCATPYKDLGDDVMPNTVALYARGTQKEVQRVMLMLNVNVPSKANADSKTLGSLCTKMVEGLAGSAPANLAQKISSRKPFEERFQGYRVYLVKEDWITGKGFELRCGIATTSFKGPI